MLKRVSAGRVPRLFLGAATVSVVVVGLIVWNVQGDGGLPSGGPIGDVAAVEDSAQIRVIRGSTSPPQRKAAKTPAADTATLTETAYVLIAPGAGPVPEAHSSPANDTSVLSAVAAWNILKAPTAPSGGGGGGEKTKLQDSVTLVVRGGDGEVREETFQ